jgi:hypothetical protein
MSSTVRKQAKLVPLALIASLALTAAAVAGSLHFTQASASGPDTNGSLTVAFKMAGLDRTVTTPVDALADATAVYGCRSPGGSFPGPAAQEVSEPVSDSGELTSGKNRQAAGQLFLNPPPSPLVCPDALTLVLVSVAYTNVEVCSAFDGCMSIPGTFRRTFFDLGPS